MIRLGAGKLKLHFIGSSNDMSHFHPSHYSVEDWFYMEPVEYLNKKEFEDFDMAPDLDKKEMDVMMDKINNGGEYHFLDSPWAYNLSRLTKAAGGSQLWQYNVINKNVDGWIRRVSCIGEKGLVRWSFFDCYIKRPILIKICNFLNSMRRYKVQNEIMKWEMYLESMRE